ncbi:hypothetical protein GQ44DRAFT_823310 [Phaeosphaeriaceae sp. PMI808]|nr:hypothetical protein GQ44DRAFT_823310 [Phaeosphaeriaceae sp. PMI808]
MAASQDAIQGKKLSPQSLPLPSPQSSSTPVRSSSPTDSDKTVVVPPPNDTATQETMPSYKSGRALFSTALGSRPPRYVRGPPFPLNIVRGNGVLGVIEAAKFWRNKFPYHTWCIFPDSGWVIEDFWDEEDIYVDSPEHYRAVLKFISQDNFWCAKKYAEDWSRKYPEQVTKTVGLENMGIIYDPANPGAIVDKIFIHGEIEEKPRQFLWHVAHIMRSALLAVRVEQKHAKVTEDKLKSTTEGHQLQDTAQAVTARSPNESSVTVSAQTSTPVVRSTPSSTVADPVPPSVVPLVPSKHHSSPPHTQQAPSFGSSQPDAHSGQPMGHAMSSMPAHTIISPSMNAPGLQNPKSTPGHSNSTIQHMHTGSSENLPRRYSSNSASRAPSGNMTGLHAPHLNPGSMTMGQPAMGFPHPIHPFAQGFPPMSSSTYPVQPYHQGLVNQGMMGSQAMHSPNPPMALGYIQPTPNIRGTRGISIGDMTNSPYYTNNIPPHNMSSHQHPNRQNSLHGNGYGSLFDPYNGARPTFNDSHVSRKPGRMSSADQSGRLRKLPAGDIRPRNGSHGADRSDAGPANSYRYQDHRPAKLYMVDDTDITSDKIRGCNHTWIGPENADVNELFVGDLPEDIQKEEIHDMFVRDMGIVPSEVTVKFKPQAVRRHAFVQFPSPSDARLALKAADANSVIRGVPVRVTVPRRFYQREPNHGPQEVLQTHIKYAKERDGRGVARGSSHEGKSVIVGTETKASQPMYSSQDARSDLQKKASQQSLKADLVSGGSLKALKPETRQNSPARHTTEKSEDIVEKESVKQENAEQDVMPDSEGTDEGKPASTDARDDTSTAKEYIGDITASRAEADTTEIGPKDSSLSITDDRLPLEKSDASIEKSFLPPLPREEVSSEIPDSKGSQTKEESLVNNETTSLALRTPVQLAIEAPSVKRTSTPGREVEGKDITGSHTSLLPHQGSPFLDEEEGPDESFSSAQEAIDNTGQTLVLGAEAPPGDHGTDTNCPNISALEEPSIELSIPGSHTDSTLAGIVTTEQATTTSSTTPKSQVAIEFEGNTRDMATASVQPSMEAIKKHGPQQTPSLNPFAKPTKAQRQKEKGQKKREKKREQGKTAKGKNDKVAATVAKTPARSNNMSQDAQITSAKSSKLNKKLESHNNEDTMVKGKDKAKVSTEDILVEVSTADDKGNAFGKQTEDKTTITPKESSPMKEKGKYLQKVPANLIPWEDPLILTALGTIAESLDQKAKEKANEKTKTSDAPNTSKVEQATPAGPNVSPSLHQSPTHSKTGQPSSGMTIIPSHLVANHTKLAQLASQGVSQYIRESDTASIASSEMLMNQSDVVPHSPSPTADDFFTPLQTPAATLFAEDQATKPKKKNKSKKKKKTTGASAPSGASDVKTELTPTVDAEASATISKDNDPSVDQPSSSNPFANGKSPIDMIQGVANNPNTNSTIVNREAKERAKDDQAQREQNQWALPENGCPTNGTMWRSIQGFLIENPQALKDINSGKYLKGTKAFDAARSGGVEGQPVNE